ERLAGPAGGVGQALGVAAETVELLTVEPRTVWTVAPTRLSVRQPVPVALEVAVVPEHAWPFDEPKGWSVATAAATAWRAPWRAASAAVLLTCTTRIRSNPPSMSRMNTGDTSANSTSSCPSCLRLFPSHLAGEGPRRAGEGGRPNISIGPSRRGLPGSAPPRPEGAGAEAGSGSWSRSPC